MLIWPEFWIQPPNSHTKGKQDFKQNSKTRLQKPELENAAKMQPKDAIEKRRLSP